MQLGRIEPEKWYHIALNTTFNLNTENTSYFGYNGSDYFSGCINDFRLYNKNLTPNEVKHLYNRQLSGGNLALHLPLTENTNNNLKDKSIYKHVTTNHGVESGDIGPVGGSIKFNSFGVISFDGVEDYINLPYAISGIKSISFWVQPSSVSQKTMIYLNSSAYIEINSSVHKLMLKILPVQQFILIQVLQLQHLFLLIGII